MLPAGTAADGAAVGVPAHCGTQPKHIYAIASNIALKQFTDIPSHLQSLPSRLLPELTRCLVSVRAVKRPLWVYHVYLYYL